MAEPCISVFSGPLLKLKQSCVNSKKLVFIATELPDINSSTFYIFRNTKYLKKKKKKRIGVNSVHSVRILSKSIK